MITVVRLVDEESEYSFVGECSISVSPRFLNIHTSVRIGDTSKYVFPISRVKEVYFQDKEEGSNSPTTTQYLIIGTLGSPQIVGACPNL